MVAAKVDPRFGDSETVFFVIGAQKAGTTWLHDYLFYHPQVCMPMWKETNYWTFVAGKPIADYFFSVYRERFGRIWPYLERAFGLLDADGRKLDKSLRLVGKAVHDCTAPHTRYADVLFAEYAESTLAVGEACPQYATLTSDIFAQMTGLAENVRFIYLLRDPAERMLSAVKDGLRRASGTEAVPTNDVENFIARCLGNPGDFHLENSNYRDNIERLENAVNMSNIKYVFFEELFDQRSVDDICAFLSIAPVPAKVRTKVNADPRPDVGISSALHTEMVKSFAPTYAYADNKFSGRLPNTWRQSMQLLEVA